MVNILSQYPHLQEILYAQNWHNSLVLEAMLDFCFAFIAGLGFAYGLNPLRRTLLWSAFFAGFGYVTRLILMQSLSIGFVGASFCASLCIGLLAIIVAKRVKAPIEVVVFPALLPMFPGSYGYKSIISLLTFIQQRDDKARLDYLLLFFDNFTIMFSVSLALVAGVLVVLSIFYEQSFMMTRGMKKFSVREH
ncbi:MULTISPECIES: threonine/serine exporter family protein [unclassified Helicobacter]|uniref:threonine/serine exporter family protein n=1 Tax=unclassified Helicobacter TaxID=2593540 RepID=UPI0009EF3DC9|nr:threonine/serine exporter family protein [Helicobacter sp. CLO-3]